MEHIRIGTRNSLLALWQAEHVASLLQKQGLSTELVTMETKGDRVLDVAISKIGSKGVFTEELEEKLRNGEVDIAVHSAKDMPSQLPEGLELIAFTTREKPFDVLVSRNSSLNLANASQSITIGTSSTRRIATLKHFYPHVDTVDIRGNLQTRIRKMDDGLCDGILLAYAGVHRMGYNELVAQKLPLDQFTPAVGQGSIAVEASTSLPFSRREAIVKAVNDSDTAACLTAERSLLQALEGGCSIPVYGHCIKVGTELTLTGGVLSLDGQQHIRLAMKAQKNAANALGQELAEQLIASGAKKILAEIRQSL